MSKYPAYKPARLGEKIVEIRNKLDPYQNSLIKYLGLEDDFFQGDISAFELGNRVPDLRTVLLLARAASVDVDALIHELDLPERFPARVKHGEGKRKG